MRARLRNIPYALLLSAAVAAISGCGSSGSTSGAITVVVGHSAPARTAARTRPAAQTTSAITTASARPATAPARTSGAAGSTTTVASAPRPGPETTRAPAHQSAARSTNTAPSATVARSSPAQCLRELTLKQVRTLGSAEWSGTGSDGTVVVRGPYGSSSAASHFAKDLHGARGGDYVVYPATHSSRLMGLANGVASCLGPGTNGYTF